MGPEQIQAYFEKQIECLAEQGTKLKAEAQEMLAQARKKMDAAKDIDEQITQIKTVKAQTQDALSRIFRRNAHA